MSRALTVMASMAALIVASVLLFNEADRTSSTAATPPPAPSAVAAATPAAATAVPTPYPLGDGEEWIAFQAADGFVELVRPDGSGRHRVLSNGDMDQGTPDWSPDGRQLVFDRDNGSASNIWITDADGSGGRALTPNTERCGPCLYQVWTRWSPDGQSIAFINQEFDISRHLRSDLAIVDVATGAVRTVVGSETQKFSAPSWSPDGSRIVLSVVTYRSLATADHDDNPPLSVDLAIVDIRAAEPTLVPIPGLPALPGHPAWSPDGTRIAFVASIDGRSGSAIYTVSPDGGDVVELYRAPQGEVLESTTWTPDGQQVLHMSRASVDSDPVLRVLDLATGRDMSAAGETVTYGWDPRMRPTP